MKLLNINQLCAAAKISRRTVYRWVSEQKLPAPVRRAGAVYWEVKSTRDALARNGRLLLA